MNGKARGTWSEFAGLNLGYLVELYDRYRSDPESASQELRSFFARSGPPPAGGPPWPGALPTPPGVDCDRISAAVALATAIRMYGYRAARLDPLGREPPGDPELSMEARGLREEDLAALPSSIVGGPVARGARNALEAVEALRRVYQGTSGFEFEQVHDASERDWLREAVESGRYRPPTVPLDGRRLLERLTQVEAFERFLQSSFPTQTRFSLEGLDILVPMLDELMAAAARRGTRSALLGMAHRGRLNVLAHVLGRPYEEIIAEFQGALPRPDIPASGSSDIGWTGDVKYHLGATTVYPAEPAWSMDAPESGHDDPRPAVIPAKAGIQASRSVEMAVTLAPNPSHLEFIDPVVNGMARASSERRDRPGPASLDEVASLPVQIHGDASFSGEGIVAETLNLSGLPGYHVGGTFHLIANNQIGFTTPPELGRSTLFASDLAKGFEIPIVHVNADDPEACIAAVRLAHAYLERFHKDVLIDLIGYRRLGHNEGDEPTFTQPVMYRSIAGHPSVRELWARELERRGAIKADEAQAMLREATERLFAARRAVTERGVAVVTEEVHPAGIEAGGTTGGLGHPGVAEEIGTAVPAAELARLNEQILSLPPGFHLHSKLESFFARRRAALNPEGDEKGRGQIDWAHAEALALASLLADGTPVRLTGQDTARGTFSQRHAVLHDAETGGMYVPLQHLPAAQAAFDVWDSPLSEAASLGFEFGYNVRAPESLVLWEAQYGDFVDAAQVIIDAFLISARSKWGQFPSLVLLLPHGYEGQGSEHSSARLERFLQMAAEDNVRIANCTTAAQYFHILRRQAKLLRSDPRPLVLLTPKSLLRHPLAASGIADLAEGRFHPVLDDPEAGLDRQAVRRLILCSGKVYVDLVMARSADRQSPEAIPAAIVRVEELYPFPTEQIERIAGSYPRLEEVVWVQEEPRNMGAWTYVAPRLRDLFAGRWPVLYAGRTRRASSAEGSYEWHAREQKRLVDGALLRAAPTAG